MVITVVSIHIKIAFVDVITDHRICRQGNRNSGVFLMYDADHGFHQVDKRLSCDLVYMICLRFIDNQVGYNAIIVLCIRCNLVNLVSAFLDKCRISIILLGIHIDPHDQFQP